jgi:hypothetical protein
MVADTPGGQWLAIISRPTLEGFSAACTPDVALGLSAAGGPVAGPAAVRHLFTITRTMDDGFAFVHQARDARRTYLEWEGGFQGSPVSGATILSYSDSGLIREIQLYPGSRREAQRRHGGCAPDRPRPPRPEHPQRPRQRPITRQPYTGTSASTERAQHKDASGPGQRHAHPVRRF